MRRDAAEGSSAATGWRPWTVWPSLAASVALLLVGRALVRPGGDPRPIVVVGLMLQNLLLVGVALLLGAHQSRLRAADFGLRRPPLLRAAALSFGLWFAVFAITAVWVGLLGLAVDDAPDITDRLAAESSAVQALLVLVMVAVIVPLGEEFLFRAYVFRALTSWCGVIPAALLSAVAFAAVHIGWVPIGLIPMVALFGFTQCLLYEWTGSLYPPLAVHALGNALATASALAWTWQAPLAIAFSILATLALARIIAALLGD